MDTEKLELDGTLAFRAIPLPRETVSEESL